MVCMDLVGHAVGPDEAPEEVRQSVFALGAERSEGTGALVDRLAHGETAEKLLTRCDSAGRIPDRERIAVQMLVGQLESGLA